MDDSFPTKERNVRWYLFTGQRLPSHDLGEWTQDERIAV